MLSRMPHCKVTDTYRRRSTTRLQRIVLLQCHAWLKLSAANHRNIVVSALPAFHESGSGKIVLILLLIATVYTTQIISQFKKIGFPSTRRTTGRLWSFGWDVDGWRQKHTACLGIVPGHWFRSLAVGALCQDVEMQREM